MEAERVRFALPAVGGERVRSEELFEKRTTLLILLRHLG